MNVVYFTCSVQTRVQQVAAPQTFLSSILNCNGHFVTAYKPDKGA